MDYKWLAETTHLSQKAIKRIEKKGLISDPLTDEHLTILDAISRIWGDEELIRMQIGTLNPTRRAKLIFGAGHNKYERYIINRILGHLSNREESKMNLHISQVVDEVLSYYKLPEKMRDNITKSAYDLRRKINNMVYRNIELKEISNRLIHGKKPKPKVDSPNKRTPADQARQNDIFGY